MNDVVATFSSDVQRRLHQAASNGEVSGGAGAPFGEILPGTDMCWAANGPFLEVLSLTTGERRAQWTFGLHLPNQIVQITCVRDWSCGALSTLPLLLVGLHVTPLAAGVLCVFDIGRGRVIHAVHVERGVTAVTPLRWTQRLQSPTDQDLMEQQQEEESENVVVQPSLSSSLVAVGTQDGFVLLVQLPSAVWLRDSVWLEQKPARLLFFDDQATVATVLAAGQLTSCVSGHQMASDGVVQHPSVAVNEHAVTAAASSSSSVFVYQGPNHAPVQCAVESTWVSCLHYVPQLHCLVVGFSFGGMQLWSMETLQVEYASSYEHDLPPVVSCAFLEPENDPRHYVYLWTVLSVPPYQDMRGSVAVAALFSLLYRARRASGSQALCRRPVVSPPPQRYRHLQQADVRLVYHLTANPQRPQTEPVAASCLLSLRTLPSAAAAATTIVSTVSGQAVTSAGSTRCALLWEVWFTPSLSSTAAATAGDEATAADAGAQSCTVLALFDLNDWYAAHLPSSVDSGRRQFFRFQSLPVQRGIAMDAVCSVTSLLDSDGGVSGDDLLPQSPSMSLDEQVSVTLLLDVGVQRCVFDSVCTCVLRRIEAEPGVLLHDAPALYSAMVSAVGAVELVDPGSSLSSRLLPALASADEVDDPERDALLTMALRVGWVSLLIACVDQWATDMTSGGGGGRGGGAVTSPLRWLLDWLWRRAVETAAAIDSVSQHLFEPTVDCTPEASAEAAETVSRASQCLHQAGACLQQLVTLLNEMLSARQCTEAGRDELQSRRHVLHLRHQHCSLLAWLVAVGVLPEQADDMSNSTNDDARRSGWFVYPCSQLVKWYSQRRRKSGTELLMVDGMVEDMGDVVSSAWKHEQDDAHYPPHSIESLCRVYLLDAVSDKLKHTLTYYLLMDLHCVDDLGVNHVVMPSVLDSFAAAFGLSSGEVRLVHAFWCLDHDQPDDALTLLLEQSDSDNQLSRRQIRRAILSLLSQGAGTSALLLMNARFSGCISPEDVRLQVRVLVENELLQQALQLERVTRSVAGPDQLLWLLQLVEQRKQLPQFRQLVLDEWQTAGYCDFLRSSRHVACQDLLYTFYIERGRYTEAYHMRRGVESGVVGSDDGVAAVSARLRQSVNRLLSRILPLDALTESDQNAISQMKEQRKKQRLPAQVDNVICEPSWRDKPETAAHITVRSRSSQIHARLELSDCNEQRSPIYHHSQTPFRPRGKRRRDVVLDSISDSRNLVDSVVDNDAVSSPGPADISFKELRPSVSYLLQTPPVGKVKRFSLAASSIAKLTPPVSRLVFDRSTALLDNHSPTHALTSTTSNISKRARVDLFDSPLCLPNSPATQPSKHFTSVTNTHSAVATSGRRKSTVSTSIVVPTIFTPGKSLTTRAGVRYSMQSVARNDMDVSTSLAQSFVNVDKRPHHSAATSVLPTIFTPGKTPHAMRRRTSVFSTGQRNVDAVTTRRTQSSVGDLSDVRMHNVDTDSVVRTKPENLIIPTIFTPKHGGDSLEQHRKLSKQDSNSMKVGVVGSSTEPDNEACLIDAGCFSGLSSLRHPSPTPRRTIESCRSTAVTSVGSDRPVVNNFAEITDAAVSGSPDVSDASFHSLNSTKSSPSTMPSDARSVSRHSHSPTGPITFAKDAATGDSVHSDGPKVSVSVTCTPRRSTRLTTLLHSQQPSTPIDKSVYQPIADAVLSSTKGSQSLNVSILETAADTSLLPAERQSVMKASFLRIDEALKNLYSNTVLADVNSVGQNDSEVVMSDQNTATVGAKHSLLTAICTKAPVEPSETQPKEIISEDDQPASVESNWLSNMVEGSSGSNWADNTKIIDQNQFSKQSAVGCDAVSIDVGAITAVGSDLEKESSSAVLASTTSGVHIGSGKDVIDKCYIKYSDSRSDTVSDGEMVSLSVTSGSNTSIRGNNYTSMSSNVGAVIAHNVETSSVSGTDDAKSSRTGPAFTDICESTETDSVIGTDVSTKFKTSSIVESIETDTASNFGTIPTIDTCLTTNAGTISVIKDVGTTSAVGEEVILSDATGAIVEDVQISSAIATNVGFATVSSESAVNEPMETDDGACVVLNLSEDSSNDIEEKEEFLESAENHGSFAAVTDIAVSGLSDAVAVKEVKGSVCHSVVQDEQNASVNVDSVGAESQPSKSSGGSDDSNHSDDDASDELTREIPLTPVSKSRKSLLVNLHPLSPLVEETQCDSISRQSENLVESVNSSCHHRWDNQENDMSLREKLCSSSAKLVSQKKASSVVDVPLPRTRRKRCFSEELPRPDMSGCERLARDTGLSEESDAMSESQFTPRRSSRLQRLREISENSPLSSNPGSPHSILDLTETEKPAATMRSRRMSSDMKPDSDKAETVLSVKDGRRRRRSVTVEAIEEHTEGSVANAVSSSVPSGSDCQQVLLSSRRKSSTSRQSVAEGTMDRSETRKSFRRAVSEEPSSPLTPRRTRRVRRLSEFSDADENVVSANVDSLGSKLAGGCSRLSTSLSKADDGASSNRPKARPDTPSRRGAVRSTRRRSMDSEFDSPQLSGVKSVQQRRLSMLSEVGTSEDEEETTTCPLDTSVTSLGFRRSTRIQRLHGTNASVMGSVESPEKSNVSSPVTAPSKSVVADKQSSESKAISQVASVRTESSALPETASATDGISESTSGVSVVKSRGRQRLGTKAAEVSSTRSPPSTSTSAASAVASESVRKQRQKRRSVVEQSATPSHQAQQPQAGEEQQQQQSADDSFTPIRLLSTEQRRKLSAALTPAHAESPAARLRRVAVKKARQRSKRQSMRLW